MFGTFPFAVPYFADPGDVDVSLISLEGKGIAQGSISLSSYLALQIQGKGIAQGSISLSSYLALQIQGKGIAQGSISLSSYLALQIQGKGIALGSANLTSVPFAAKNPGRALVSASLSSYSSPRAHCISRSRASVTLGYFVSVVVGPAIPGYPSIQESLPQRISMFGFEMQPILDVLRLRHVPLSYVSPPVCQPAAPVTSGSAFATPMIV